MCERLIAIIILGIENESVYLLTTHVAVLLPSVVYILWGSSSCFQALKGEAFMIEPCVVDTERKVCGEFRQGENTTKNTTGCGVLMCGEIHDKLW